jgi:L-asparaginase
MHLSIHKLLGSAGLPGEIDLRAVDLFDVPSTFIGPNEMLALAQAVESALEAGADAAVVTHGTDTLEETAFCVDLLHADNRPVVFTGAMRAPELPGADGAMNLRDAVVVAADRDAAGLGVMVVMAGQIHAAQDVRKEHSTSLTAFGSGERGLLGRVEEGRVLWARRPLRARPQRPPALDARVEGVKCYAGMSEVLLRAALSNGADAIVLEAMGSGQVPPWIMPALREAASAGILLVVTSRCGEGPLLREHHGLPTRVPGDERDLLEAGALFCELPGTKARIKTIVGLSAGLSQTEMADWL